MSNELNTATIRSPADFVRDQCDALRYEHSLVDFIGAFWRYVEPGEFQKNWHIDAICEHLEAAANQQIDRLLINMPPRHMKSLCANVFYPAWLWAQDPNPDKDPKYSFQISRNSWRGPGVKLMHLSYDGQLATRDGVKCRQIIASEPYQRLWGKRFTLRPDQNQKTRFENSSGGCRISTSEGGLITGEGGDIIIFDDPHNVRDIGGASDVARENTLRFWDESLPSRLNDQDSGVFIVIMQRVHERDLSGHIMAREQGWTHLCLPAEYEAKHPFPIRTSVIHKSTGKIWADPRKDGEPLWPERFSSDALHRMAKDETMSSHMAAGQLQQRPTARDGGMFKRAWFANPAKFVDLDQLQLVRAWDLAWTADVKSDPDFSVGVLMGIDYRTRALYVIDVIRERLSPANLERRIVSASIVDGEQCTIRIPKDPGAGGFYARYLASKLQGRSINIEPEQKSKEARAAPFASQCEIGMVKLLEGPWNQRFIDELCAFPNGAHDDQVDAATAAFRALVSQGPVHAVAA